MTWAAHSNWKECRGLGGSAVTALDRAARRSIGRLSPQRSPRLPEDEGGRQQSKARASPSPVENLEDRESSRCSPHGRQAVVCTRAFYALFFLTQTLRSTPHGENPDRAVAGVGTGSSSCSATSDRLEQADIMGVACSQRRPSPISSAHHYDIRVWKTGARKRPGPWWRPAPLIPFNRSARRGHQLVRHRQVFPRAQRGNSRTRQPAGAVAQVKIGDRGWCGERRRVHKARPRRSRNGDPASRSVQIRYVW